MAPNPSPQHPTDPTAQKAEGRYPSPTAASSAGRAKRSPSATALVSTPRKPDRRAGGTNAGSLRSTLAWPGSCRATASATGPGERR